MTSHPIRPASAVEPEPILPGREIGFPLIPPLGNGALLRADSLRAESRHLQKLGSENPPVETVGGYGTEISNSTVSRPRLPAVYRAVRPV